MWSGIANWGHRPKDYCNTLAAATKRSNLAGCVCRVRCVYVCVYVRVWLHLAVCQAVQVKHWDRDQ